MTGSSQSLHILIPHISWDDHSLIPNANSGKVPTIHGRSTLTDGKARVPIDTAVNFGIPVPHKPSNALEEWAGMACYNGLTIRLSCDISTATRKMARHNQLDDPPGPSPDQFPHEAWQDTFNLPCDV